MQCGINIEFCPDSSLYLARFPHARAVCNSIGGCIALYSSHILEVHDYKIRNHNKFITCEYTRCNWSWECGK